MDRTEPEFTNKLCAIQKAFIEMSGDCGQDGLTRNEAISFYESIYKNGFDIIEQE